MSNVSRAGGLDLDALAARIKVIECGYPDCGDPDCDVHRLSLAVIEECRALRTALRPFALQVGPQEGDLMLMRQKNSTYFQVARLAWDDLNRAVEVLGAGGLEP